MNKIKDTFTIQDFEILTGIKAHTIRIWEKRYNLLSPSRINRNVRVYSLSDLQKILNISLLYKNNYKISKIAKLSVDLLSKEAKTVALSKIEKTDELWKNVKIHIHCPEAATPKDGPSAGLAMVNSTPATTPWTGMWRQDVANRRR